MAKLADALDLGSSSARSAGSIPVIPTIFFKTSIGFLLIPQVQNIFLGHLPRCFFSVVLFRTNQGYPLGLMPQMIARPSVQAVADHFAFVNKLI